jgi:xanthine dehydrogenase accessory factor
LLLASVYNPLVHEAVFAAALRALERGEDAALVTIVSTQGSTPQRVGARMLVFADGRSVGTIGGGCYENDAAGRAREAIRTRKAGVARYDLSDALAEESGLICGGRMEVFIEPLDPSPRLVVVGAGHVSQHVARMASDVGFRVHVIDDREAFANRDRFPSADDVTVAKIPAFLQAADIPAATYVVVVTRGHTHDLSAMRTLAGRPLRYVGMIGSRAKVVRIFEALAAEGVAQAWLDQVRAPIGLKIGAITPEEIAVSIVAELIAVRRGVPAAPAATSMKDAR